MRGENGSTNQYEQIGSTSRKSRNMYTQVRPSGEFLTNYLTLLWVQVGLSCPLKLYSKLMLYAYHTKTEKYKHTQRVSLLYFASRHFLY